MRNWQHLNHFALKCTELRQTTDPRLRVRNLGFIVLSISAYPDQYEPEEVALVEPGVPATPGDVTVKQVLARLGLALVLFALEDTLEREISNLSI